MSLKSYGATETAASGDDPLALALEELSRNGFTVLERVVPATPLTAMRAALDRLLAAQTDRFGGPARLSEIGEGGQARALLEEEPVFFDLLRIPRLDAIVEALLGSAALVIQQNGIVMPPAAGEHHQQSWHRDLPYQSWVSTKPLALGALARSTLSLPRAGPRAFFPARTGMRRFPSEAYPRAGRNGRSRPRARGGIRRHVLPRRRREPRQVPETRSEYSVRRAVVRPADHVDAEAEHGRHSGVAWAYYQPAASADAWRAARRSRLQGTRL